MLHRCNHDSKGEMIVVKNNRYFVDHITSVFL